MTDGATDGAGDQPPFDPLRFPDRANLGCGFDRRVGYLNVDYADGHHPDLLADIRELGMLPSDHYVEVIASECLEHLPRHDAARALAEWVRIMTPGGRIELRSPNVVELAHMLEGTDTLENHHGILEHMYGIQAYTGDYHLSGFSDITLIDAMARAGLQDVVVLRNGWLHEAVGVKAAAGVATSPVALAWNDGFHAEESAGGERWRWAQSRAELLLFNTAEVPVDVAIRARVCALGAGTPARLTVSAPFDIETAIGAEPLALVKTVRCAPGHHRVVFETDAAPLGTPDPRTLTMKLAGLDITAVADGRPSQPDTELPRPPGPVALLVALPGKLRTAIGGRR